MHYNRSGKFLPLIANGYQPNYFIARILSMTIEYPIHNDDDMFQLTEFVLNASKLCHSQKPIILELPSGYGRVTRKLVEKFGAKSIYAAELLTPAINFCIDTFGVAGYQVEDPITEFRNIPNNFFDIAVMGSLITHLSEADSRTVVKYFFDKLKPNGIGVITTTGNKACDLFQNSVNYVENVCQIGEQERLRLISEYKNNLFSHAKYSSDHTFEKKTVENIGEQYGYSLIPKSWVENICIENKLRIIDFFPGGWDDHQDVYFIAKNL